MLENQSNNIFYVYKHTFSNGAVYIGKGKAKRAHDFYKRGELWLRHYRKHGVPNIEILKDNMIEPDSFKYEVEAISDIKKSKVFLINHTDGGEGMSGHIHSEETRIKIGEAQIGDKNHMFGVVGANHPNFGRKWSAESRHKMSQSIKGRKLSEQWKMNIGKNWYGNKNPRFKNVIYNFIHKDGIQEVCTQNELYKKYSLSSSKITLLTQLVRISHKGWTVSKEAMPLSYKHYAVTLV